MRNLKTLRNKLAVKCLVEDCGIKMCLNTHKKPSIFVLAVVYSLQNTGIVAVLGILIPQTI